MEMLEMKTQYRDEKFPLRVSADWRQRAKNQ